MEVKMNAVVINMLRRGEGRILEQDESGYLAYDQESRNFVLSHPEPAMAIAWLQKHFDLDQEAMLVVMNRRIVPALKEEFHLHGSGPCYQLVWNKPGNTGYDPHQSPLVFRPAQEEDFQLIRSLYQLTSDEEILFAIANEQLYLTYLPDAEGASMELVGMIGEHSEGSLGFLLVLESWRRQGYGLEMLRFMIERMLAENLIPYSHIFKENTASLALHQKAGMEKCQREIEWMSFTPTLK